MGRVVGIFFLSLGAFTLSYGQEFTVKHFLKSSLEDPYYKSFDQTTQFLNNSNNYRLPWLKEFQFRYQDNEFQDLDQRYSLRFDPGNPWQISNNKKYFKGISSLKILEQRVALKEILKEKYEKIIEYYFLEEETQLSQAQKKKRDDIVYAIGRKSNSSSFDPDQYLNAQIDVISKEADLQEVILERDIALTGILTEANQNSFRIDQSTFISIDQINQIIEPNISLANKSEIDFLKQRIALSDQKIKLEKSNVDIGYFQPMYTNRENKFRSPGGFSFGVTIPLFNNNRDDIAREKISQLERQGELARFQSEENAKLLTTVALIQIHFNHYQKLDSILSTFQERGLSNLVGLSHNNDPVIELKYQEKMIQFEILKCRIRKEIFTAYLEWLDKTDKLSERPLINYLSGNLERIED